MKMETTPIKDIKDVAQMNTALFSRRIGLEFIAYACLVLNVKRGIGMFSSLHKKNVISTSDPKQGAAYHSIMVMFIKGILDHGFRLYNVEDDELRKLMNPSTLEADPRLYLKSASEMLASGLEALRSFDMLTGPLKFAYTDSLKEHFHLTSSSSSSSSLSSSSASSLSNSGQQHNEDDGDDEDEGEGITWYVNSDGEKIYYTEDEIAEYEAELLKQQDGDEDVNGAAYSPSVSSDKRKVSQTREI